MVILLRLDEGKSWVRQSLANQHDVAIIGGTLSFVMPDSWRTTGACPNNAPVPVWRSTAYCPKPKRFTCRSALTAERLRMGQIAP